MQKVQTMTMTKPLDWPVMIHQLVDQGMTQMQIAKQTGISTTTVEKVMSEKCPPIKGWNEGINLLDLYLIKLNSEPPRFGEYHAILDKEASS